MRKWSEDDVKRWLKAISKGKTVKEVAASEGLTKSVLSGAIWRYGYSADGSGRKVRTRQEVTRQHVERQRANAMRRTVRKAPKMVAPKGPLKTDVGRPDKAWPERDGPTLEQIKRVGQCYWPVTWDKPFKFCGKSCTGKYCTEHQAMSVREDQPKPIRVRV